MRDKREVTVASQRSSRRMRKTQNRKGENVSGRAYFIHFNRRADRKCGQRCGDTGGLMLGANKVPN